MAMRASRGSENGAGCRGMELSGERSRKLWDTGRESQNPRTSCFRVSGKERDEGKNKSKSNGRGDGQECPSHTCRPTWVGGRMRPLLHGVSCSCVLGSAR